MRNVTITLDGETARWARIEAARNDTSVSKLVGAVLRERMHQRDAALPAGTEGLQHGQDLDGLRVVNPFEEPPPSTD